MITIDGHVLDAIDYIEIKPVYGTVVIKGYSDQLIYVETEIALVPPIYND